MASRVALRGAVFAALAGAFAAIGVGACKDDATVNPVADPIRDAASDVVTCAAPKSALFKPVRPLRVLFFTKETLYFHTGAHDVGNTAVSASLRADGHDVTISDDVGLFTPAGLAKFDVILFFVTSGIFLSPDQRAAFQGFVRSGKGVAGVHTASATELDNPFFRDVIGASFAGHGVGDAQVIPGNVLVVDAASPLTSFLPSPWTWTDEFYYYSINPAKNPAIAQLLVLDESSIAQYYPGYPEAGFYGAAGHPLAWTQDFQCSRVWYTALGHSGAAYADPAFVRFIVTGTEWAGAAASAAAP